MEDKALFSHNLGSVGLGAPVPDNNCLIGYSLVVPAHFEFDAETAVYSIRAILSVAVSTRGVWRRVGEMLVSPDAVPSMVGGSRGRGRNWKLRIDLTTAQLAAIEEARNGTDLRIKVDIAVGHDLAAPQGLVAAVAAPERTVASSDCLRLMQSLGACDVLEFAICIPKGDERLQQVIDHIRAAQHELHLLRRPRVAIRHCLQALEALTVYRDDAAEFNDIKNGKTIIKRSERSVDQRLQFVRDSLQNLAGGSMHGDAAAESLDYDVPVARATIAMCIAIVAAYVERSVTEA